MNDLVTLHISVFMYKSHKHLLSPVFNSFFKKTLSFPKVGTNYGIFNAKLQGAKIWNEISAGDAGTMGPDSKLKVNLFYRSYICYK